MPGRSPSCALHVTLPARGAQQLRPAVRRQKRERRAAVLGEHPPQRSCGAAREHSSTAAFGAEGPSRSRKESLKRSPSRTVTLALCVTPKKITLKPIGVSWLDLEHGLKRDLLQCSSFEVCILEGATKHLALETPGSDFQTLRLRAACSSCRCSLHCE